MRSCYQPDVDLVGAVAAEPLEFLLLQDAEQFRLKFQRYIANLIQEKRPLIGELKAPRFLSDGAGECSLFVAKQLALEQSDDLRCNDRAAQRGGQAQRPAFPRGFHVPADPGGS